MPCWPLPGWGSAPEEDAGRLLLSLRPAPAGGVGPLRSRLLELAEQEAVLGTVLLAEEGINGSLSGPADGVERILTHLQGDPRLTPLAIRRSTAEQHPFFRLKVRLRQEIVTLGVAGVDPLSEVGTYVPPAAWNALIQHPRTLVVDTRNGYEVGLGTFTGAIDPAPGSSVTFPAGWKRSSRP